MQFVQALVVQEILHGENFKDRANDPMEEDNDANNIVKEDEEEGTNGFIQETFNNVGIDDDGDYFDATYGILYFRGKVTLFMKDKK